MPVPQKDLSSLYKVFKLAPSRMNHKEVYEHYSRVCDPNNAASEVYLKKVVMFGVKDGFFTGQKIKPVGKRGGGKQYVDPKPAVTEAEFTDFLRRYRKFNLKYKGKKKKIVYSTPAISGNGSAILSSFSPDRKNPNKQYVEMAFLSTIKNFLNGDRVKCLSISGPYYKRHIDTLFSTVANKVCIVEIDNDIFNHVFQEAKTCPHYQAGRVSIMKCDISEVVLLDCQFIDLDLMRSLNNIGEKIISQVIGQTTFNKEGALKHISFTASIRGDGGEEKRFNLLKNILSAAFDADLKGFHGESVFGDRYHMTHSTGKWHHCSRHIPMFNDQGSIVDMQFFTYKDGAPMMSVLITYK